MASNGSTNGAADYTVPLLINGEDVVSKTTFPVNNPSTNQPAWNSSGCSKDDALKAVETAQAVFPKWASTTPSERRDIFTKAAALFEKKTDELIDIMAKETGADAGWGGFNVMLTCEALRDCGGRIAAAVEGVLPTTADPGRTAMVLKEPYGVVLGIAPWNAPYILGVRACLFALAAGNTCVLKGSEMSPRCYYAIGSILKEAGVPAGVLNVIFHRPQDAAEITDALIGHPSIKKVNFTGSSAVGSIVASLAGKHIKPVLMELGGKAPAIVLADADLQKAAQGCVVGSFLYSGQICMSTERIIVHSSIKEKFAEALNGGITAMFDPKGEAPVMISEAGTAKTKKLVSDALAAGAKPLNGDAQTTEEISKTRMRPIVVEGVTKDMALYYNESFGLSVSFITVDSEEEAIKVANDTEYGLAASVFTENLQTGLRVARQIESGAVHINAMTVHDEARLPHGGMKRSGFGRFGGSWGLDEFLRLKTITFQN